MTSPFLPEDDPADVKTPWGFRFTIGLTAIYLLYRLIQGVVWLAHRLF